MKIKPYIYGLLFILLIIPIQTFAQDVSPNPTRPSAADNAYLTQPGYTELEFGLSSQTNFWNLPTLLKFSFHENVEVGFLMSGLLNHFDSENEIGAPGLQLKTKLTDQSWRAFAVAGRIERVKNLRPKYNIYTIGSFLIDKISIDGTLGASFFDQGNGDYSNSVQYAVSFNSNFEGQIGGFFEVFGENSDYSNPLFVDGGLSYTISKKAVLDCSIALGLNDDADDWIFQVGFTSVLYKVLK
jgi:hypothetical protein